MTRAFLGGFLGSLLGPTLARVGRKVGGGILLVLALAVVWLVQWFLAQPWWLRVLIVAGLVLIVVARWTSRTRPARAVVERVREPIPQALREWVIDRDQGVCGICGFRVRAGEEHIDHIHPVHAGGTNDPGNLQTAHSECNLRKGGMVGWQPPYRREVS